MQHVVGHVISANHIVRFVQITELTLVVINKDGIDVQVEGCMVQVGAVPARSKQAADVRFKVGRPVRRVQHSLWILLCGQSVRYCGIASLKTFGFV